MSILGPQVAVKGRSYINRSTDYIEYDLNRLEHSAKLGKNVKDIQIICMSKKRIISKISTTAHNRLNIAHEEVCKNIKKIKSGLNLITNEIKYENKNLSKELKLLYQKIVGTYKMLEIFNLKCIFYFFHKNQLKNINKGYKLCDERQGFRVNSYNHLRLKF